MCFRAFSLNFVDNLYAYSVLYSGLIKFESGCQIARSIVKFLLRPNFISSKETMVVSCAEAIYVIMSKNIYTHPNFSDFQKEN